MRHKLVFLSFISCLENAEAVLDKADLVGLIEKEVPILCQLQDQDMGLRSALKRSIILRRVKEKVQNLPQGLADVLEYTSWFEKMENNDWHLGGKSKYTSKNGKERYRRQDRFPLRILYVLAEPRIFPTLIDLIDRGFLRTPEKRTQLFTFSKIFIPPLPQRLSPLFKEEKVEELLKKTSNALVESLEFRIESSCIVDKVRGLRVLKIDKEKLKALPRPEEVEQEEEPLKRFYERLWKIKQRIYEGEIFFLPPVIEELRRPLQELEALGFKDIDKLKIWKELSLSKDNLGEFYKLSQFFSQDLQPDFGKDPEKTPFFSHFFSLSFEEQNCLKELINKQEIDDVNVNIEDTKIRDIEIGIEDTKDIKDTKDIDIDLTDKKHFFLNKLKKRLESLILIVYNIKSTLSALIQK
jgi:hypothetical protein